MPTPSADRAARPRVRPNNPQFSSGPCTKHPGWSLTNFDTSSLGRNHRSSAPKARLKAAIDRASALMALPDDWVQGIVPASDTGAFELAMWSLLGERDVDAFVWESFSNDWAMDLATQLQVDGLHIHRADYGHLADLSLARAEADCVFVYNGTTSGVRVPGLDWISEKRTGLTLCDATSAVFAMPIDYAKLDVVTWSWQKVLGGEGGFGMLALSPRAVARLESFSPGRPLPKIFRVIKNGALDRGLFKGSTLNTPSLLAVEDLHSAFAWAESIGGLSELHRRSQRNFEVVDSFVATTDWLAWLAVDPATRSSTSMCLSIVDDAFKVLDSKAQRSAIKSMCAVLEAEDVAYDIAAYRNAPPGFRLWGGATVEAADLEAVLPWLDWAFNSWRRESKLTKGA